ncbi:DUF305 domain-containing protein [Streptomyces roseifaciens]
MLTVHRGPSKVERPVPDRRGARPSAATSVTHVLNVRSIPFQEDGRMSMARGLRRCALMTAAVPAMALMLVGCGGNDDSGRPPSTAEASTTVPAGQHNQADVAFAQGMVPHHRQAIVMSEMAENHASSGDVKALAEKIKKAQAPEIDTMTAWLNAWGEPVPRGLSGTGHGSPTGMPGMMTDRQMDDLRGTTGSPFDRMFLTMMIAHHQGAIDMAGTEKKQGQYGPAEQLADSIITSQTAEIAQMRTMLGSSSP